MSFWILKRDDTGHLHYTSVSVPIFPIIALIALFVTCLMSVIGSLNSIGISLVFSIGLGGFVLFCTAKMSVIRRGQLLSFGTAAMSPRMRHFYYIGYALMLPGAVVTFLWSCLMLAKR